MTTTIKNILGVLAFAGLTLSLPGCTHEEVSTYDPANTSLNIWVGNEYSVYESTSYNYSYAYEEGAVTFYAQISGMPANHDRKFTLEPYGDSYEIMANTIRQEEYTLPAGEIKGEYQVHFNTQKLSDPDLFTVKDGTISFRVKPSDVFELGAEGRQSFTVILRNYLAKPDNWDSANYPRVPLSNYFGTYSRTKYQFMIEHLGMSEFDITYFASTSYDEATNTVSPAYAVYLQQLMQEALIEYNATHDTPLTDEFGNLVTF